MYRFIIACWLNCKEKVHDLCFELLFIKRKESKLFFEEIKITKMESIKVFWI